MHLLVVFPFRLPWTKVCLYSVTNPGHLFCYLLPNKDFPNLGVNIIRNEFYASFQWHTFQSCVICVTQRKYMFQSIIRLETIKFRLSDPEQMFTDCNARHFSINYKSTLWRHFLFETLSRGWKPAFIRKIWERKPIKVQSMIWYPAK